VWYFTRSCSCICIHRSHRPLWWWWLVVVFLAPGGGKQFPRLLVLETKRTPRKTTTIGKVVLLAGCCGLHLHLHLSASICICNCKLQLLRRFVSFSQPFPSAAISSPLPLSLSCAVLSCAVLSCPVLSCPIRCLLSPCLAKLPASHPPAKSPTERSPQTQT
jgi:hypothetical protein